MDNGWVLDAEASGNLFGDSKRLKDRVEVHAVYVTWGEARRRIMNLLSYAEERLKEDILVRGENDNPVI